MGKRTILDDLIQEIGSLLAYAQSLADKPLDKPIDPAVVKRLEEMEKAVALLKETTIKDAMEFGITEEEMTRGIHKMPEGMTANQERVWKRLNELRWDAEGMRFALARAVKKEKGEEGKKKMSKKKRIRKRRERFGPLGGRKHWKPL